MDKQAPPITAEDWAADQRAFFAAYELYDAQTGLPFRVPVPPMGMVTNLPAFVERQIQLAVQYWGNTRIAGPPIRRLLAAREYVAQNFQKLPAVDEEE